MDMCRGEQEAAGLSLYEPDPHLLCSQMLTENHKPDQNIKEARECFYVAESDKVCVPVLRLLHCKNYKESLFLLQVIFMWL